MSWSKLFSLFKSPEEMGKALHEICGYSGRSDEKTARAFQLIDAGAQLDVRSYAPAFTTLIWATYFNHAEIARKMIDAGVKVDDVDADGRTALMWAAREDRPEMIDIFIDGGAVIDRRDNNQLTALQHAAKLENVQCAERLIAAGADIEAKNDAGQTALHHAVLARDPDIVEILMKLGANPRAPDHKGNTPLSLGRELYKHFSNRVIIDLLEKMTPAYDEIQTRRLKEIKDSGVAIEKPVHPMKKISLKKKRQP